MADITGTEGADTLNGTSDADTINALGGDDIVYTAGGADTVEAGDGDDLIILNGPINLATFNGGAGSDAMILQVLDSTSPGLFGTTSAFRFYSTLPSSFSGIETLEFQSIAGEAVDALISDEQLAGSDLTTLKGGDGIDRLIVYTTSEFSTIPNFHLDNWSPLFDIITLVWNSIDDATLYARSNLDSVQGLFGDAGNDTLFGAESGDLLNGGAGNDTLVGGLGNDTLIGALGDDVFFIDAVGDLIVEDEGGGTDRIVTSISYALSNGAEIETFAATLGAGAIDLTGNGFGQSLYGTDSSNWLRGMAGSDYLVGLGGNDQLDGGAGDDNLAGGTGNDVYYTDQQGDRVIETAGAGDDLVFVIGSFILAEGSEVEALMAFDAAATAILNLSGNEFGQSLYGNAGINFLQGGAGNDYLVGGAGNDFLAGGTGADNLQGGAGNDTYYADQLGDAVYEAIGEGDDTLVAGGSHALREGSEVEALHAIEGSDPVTMRGNEFGQSIYGNAGDNVLYGAAGNDYLVGGAGNDFLDGGTGADNLQGGTGNDVYFIDAIDTLFEFTGEGNDTILVDGSFVLDAGVSIETLLIYPDLAANAYDLTGNEIGQSLYGHTGANVLQGLGGNDYLVAGSGDDSLVGGAGSDNLKGEAGADRFLYADTSDSTAAEGDHILDLEAGDLIDLAAIDAVPGGENDAFSFIGTAAFSSTAGELRAELQNNGDWLIEADTDGNGLVDFLLLVTVTGGHTIVASDFVL